MIELTDEQFALLYEYLDREHSIVWDPATVGQTTKIGTRLQSTVQEIAGQNGLCLGPPGSRAHGTEWDDMDLLICLDDVQARHVEGPDYGGLWHTPIGALYTVHVTEPDGEWKKKLLGEGLTVAEARDLADRRGYGGLRYLD
jgi:hypothetical protein